MAEPAVKVSRLKATATRKKDTGGYQQLQEKERSWDFRAEILFRDPMCSNHWIVEQFEPVLWAENPSCEKELDTLVAVALVGLGPPRARRHVDGVKRAAMFTVV